MSQLKNKNSSTLQYLSAFLFMALMCCNQIFQFSHLHHFHEDDGVAFEVSYHPLGLVVEHSSAHQHGEESFPHPDDDRYNYENKADCKFTQSQSIHTVVHNELSLFFSIIYLPLEGFGKAISFHQEPSATQEEYSSFSVIRGPPQFG